MDAYRDQYAQLFGNGKRATLLAISVDADTTLANWAKESDFPFRFLSDSTGAVGRLYGARNEKYHVDDRSLFVVGPDGKIAYVAAPFREIDPLAYRQLDSALTSIGRSRK
ncbi:MAG TPA: redoxin domain-containing protein [Gemmatimonadales bacterium]|nr:redoxin domain-containing protein [Gemmatimonadales bacterium]